MNEKLDTVIFKNPITGQVEQMPVAMIGAYLPCSDHLCLEEAARVAAIRDDEAATNLLLSVTDTMLASTHTEYQSYMASLKPA